MTHTHKPADWQVTHVSASDRSGIYIQGINHLAGDSPFAWHIAHHSLLWSYRERYGRFRGASFAPGTRLVLARLLRLARKG